MSFLRNGAVRKGFTLVELLVVIGIIAVLISILLPSLAKVRRQAQGTACLSNMRQVAAAVMMYANENRYWMPCRATKNQCSWNSSGPQNSGGSITNTANWIAYEVTYDPYQGNALTGWGTNGDQNVTYSALAPYLNMPYTLSSYNGTGGLPVSGDVNAQYGKVFLCPADDPTQRPKSQTVAVGQQQSYLFSYGMNAWIDNPLSYPDAVTTVNGVAMVKAQGPRSWGKFNGKITSIVNTADIVMLIDQDPLQNSSGEVSLCADSWVGGLANSCNPVHYGNNNIASALVAGQVNQDGYGNAAFCDGHASITSRKDCERQIHTGDPVPDPAGF
jgi:prepilin-type N-terminal cleavage/methylation domain-containing protein/prepilin-type processing-associated H-X9-DG protein